LTEPEKRPQDARFSETLEETNRRPKRPFDASAFTRDFLTGCLALAAVSVIGLVLVPVLIIVFKISALLIVPLGLLAIFVILTAFLGRIINLLRGRWPQGKG